jgi:hypothetical protein
MRHLGVLEGGPPPDDGDPPPDDGGGGGDEDGEGDDDAPQTTIVKEPDKRSDKGKAKFKFRSDEAGSSFECKLRGPGVKRKLESWRDCDSPQKYKRLDEGKHKFKVRATDSAGNTDPTPAKFRWKVLEG